MERRASCLGGLAAYIAFVVDGTNAEVIIVFEALRSAPMPGMRVRTPRPIRERGDATFA